MRNRVQAARPIPLRKIVTAILSGASRLTYPETNQSAKRALIVSRKRVDGALDLGASDDWCLTGDSLRDALRGLNSRRAGAL